MKDHAYRNRSRAPEPVLYRPYAQFPNMSTQPRPLIVHALTDRTAAASLPTVRKAMAEFDPNGPAFVTSLTEETSFEIRIRKVLGYLLSSIGALGLLLAPIGLYGVMAYVVASSTPEIALRMALARLDMVVWVLQTDEVCSAGSPSNHLARLSPFARGNARV